MEIFRRGIPDLIHAILDGDPVVNLQSLVLVDFPFLRDLLLDRGNCRELLRAALKKRKYALVEYLLVESEEQHSYSDPCDKRCDPESLDTGSIR